MLFSQITDLLHEDNLQQLQDSLADPTEIHELSDLQQEIIAQYDKQLVLIAQQALSDKQIAIEQLARNQASFAQERAEYQKLMDSLNEKIKALIWSSKISNSYRKELSRRDGRGKSGE